MTPTTRPHRSVAEASTFTAPVPSDPVTNRVPADTVVVKVYAAGWLVRWEEIEARGRGRRVELGTMVRVRWEEVEVS